MILQANILVFKKYSLKYLRVKGYQACNCDSNGLEKGLNTELWGVGSEGVGKQSWKC